MNRIFPKIVAASTLAALMAIFVAHTALAALSVQISGVANGAYYNSGVRPTYNAPGASSVSATLNGGAFTGGTLVSTEGNYLLTVTAVSSGGATFKNVRFTIDNTAPVINITGVSNGQTYTDQSVRPVFTTNEGSISATLNGGSISSGTLISTVGNYLLTVTAADAAGNVTFRSIRFTLNKSTTPPVVPPVTPPTTPETPGTPAVPVPTSGTTKTAKIIKRFAKAVTVTPVPTETCAVPCADPMDAVLRDVSMTKAESADGLGGNLNSCRNVRITGHAQDGLLVILYIKKEGTDVPLIGFVKAGAGDQYQFTTDRPLSEGFYTVFAKLAQEGGKTGPMIEVGNFQVDKCSRWLVWFWIAIALVVLILGGIAWWLASRRRRSLEEEGELITEEPLEEAIDSSREDRL